MARIRYDLNVHDYKSADQFLGSKLERKLCNNTIIYRLSAIPGDAIGITLHNTRIITFFADGCIRLNTGGWNTATTRHRFKSFASSVYGGKLPGRGADLVTVHGEKFSREITTTP